MAIPLASTALSAAALDVSHASMNRMGSWWDGAKAVGKEYVVGER